MFAPHVIGDERLALDAFALGILLRAGDGERAGRFEDAAGVLEDVLDRGAERVGVDRARTSSTSSRHRRKVSSPTSLTAVPSENRPTSGSVTRSPALTDCAIASESSVCTPITLISGRTALTYAATPAISPPPPIGDEDRVDRALMLAQDLHRDRALAGDHVGIVERMHEGQAALFLQLDRMRIGVAVDSPTARLRPSAPPARAPRRSSPAASSPASRSPRGSRAAPPTAPRPARDCPPTRRSRRARALGAEGAPSCCTRRAA